MDLRPLETFVAVARAGSVSAASRELYLSQSAVSRQVQQLERQLSVELFVRRGGRAVELTEVGQRVLELGDDLLARTQRLSRELEKIAVEGRERVILGVSSSTLLLPEIQQALGGFHARHPNVDLTLAESHHYREILDSLAAGEIDAGLAPVPPGALSDRYAVEPIASLAPRVFLSRRHPLAGRELLRLEDVAEHSFVFLEGASGMEIFDEACVAAGVAPRISHRCQQVVTLVALIGTGMAITMLFGEDDRPVPPPLDATLTSVPLDIPCPPMAMALLWNAEEEPRGAARLFVEDALESLRPAPPPA